MEKNAAPLSAMPTTAIDCGSVELFTAEAEATLSALYQTVREAYGDTAANSAAQRWLDLFENRLAAAETEQPFLRSITRAVIRLFVDSRDFDAPGQSRSPRPAIGRA